MSAGFIYELVAAIALGSPITGAALFSRPMGTLAATLLMAVVGVPIA